MKINYFIDERVEFFQSLLNVSGYWNHISKLYTGSDLNPSKYRSDVLNFFNGYENHKSIEILKEICNNIKELSDVIRFPFSFEIEGKKFVLKEFSNELLNNFGGKDKVLALLSQMEELYDKTGYKAFFDSLNQKEILFDKKQTEIIEQKLDFLGKYISSEFSTVDICLIPLVFGTFGISSNNNHIIVGTSPYIYQGKFIWGPVEEYIARAVLKFVIMQNISATPDVLKDIPSKNDSTEFYNKEMSFIETIIIGIVIRIKLLNDGSPSQQELISAEEKQGFSNISEIYSKILSAEGNNQTLDIQKLLALLKENA